MVLCTACLGSFICNCLIKVSLSAKKTLDYLVSKFYTVLNPTNSPAVIVQYAYRENAGSNTLIDSAKWANHLEGHGLFILNDIHQHFI